MGFLLPVQNKINGTNLLDFFSFLPYYFNAIQTPELIFAIDQSCPNKCNQFPPPASGIWWYAAPHISSHKKPAHKPDHNQTMFYCCCCICDCLVLFGATRFLRDWLDYFYSSKSNTYTKQKLTNAHSSLSMLKAPFLSPPKKCKLLLCCVKCSVCVLKQENFRKSKKINQQHLHKQTGKLSELRVQSISNLPNLFVLGPK